MAKRVFRTKKKLSGGKKVFRKWSEWTEGDVLIGKLIGTHEDNYQNTCLVLKVVDPQFKSAKEAKKFEGLDIVLNSSGATDRVVEQLQEGKIEEGEMLQISYNGMETMEGGKYKGKERHLIDIETVEEESGEESQEEESDDDSWDDED